jgi:hypothetical protein
MTSIICPQVPIFETSDHDAAQKAFSVCPVLEMGQTWRQMQEQTFQPGNVRVGWHGNDLVILAFLTDTSIVTGATKNNQLLCELGDTFEVFLGESGSECYMEFHVDPTGKKLQLRWPNTHAIQEVMEGKVNIERFFVESPLFVYSCNVRHGVWRICASFSGMIFNTDAKSLKGRTWRVSFSRYDYSSNKKEPVLSSTSPHTEMFFHRQNEWSLFEFQ